MSPTGATADAFRTTGLQNAVLGARRVFSTFVYFLLASRRGSYIFPEYPKETPAMNAPTAAMTTAPKSFTCAKCDGRGRLDWAAHYANGVCFWCKGSGRIANRDITNDKWYRMQINNLKRTAEAVMWGADNDRNDYAEAYMRGMIEDMRKVGTEGAREVLKHIRAGSYYESSTNTSHTISQAAATRLIERLIEMGREALAQEQAAA